MTVFTTIGERINLSACDAGHESDDDMPQLISIEGLGQSSVEIFLCAAHRASLLAMLRRRFPGNDSLRAAVVADDDSPWIQGDAPMSDWAEVTPEMIHETCTCTGQSARAWWLTFMRLTVMGVWEVARDDQGRTYMRMWSLSDPKARP